MPAPIDSGFAAATPRPWFDITFDDTVTEGTPRVGISCTWPDYIEVASMSRGLTAAIDEQMANARLIVTAVNAFDELVLAAKEAAVVIADIAKITGDAPQDSPVLMRLTAAIAKATPEKGAP